MIEFKTSIKPFIAQNGCGDFAFNIDCQESYLICVGDIGGHGNIKIRKLALQIEEFINENKQKNIYDIFNLVAKIEKIKLYGMTFFIGRIDKSLSLLQYICVGNIKLHIIRDNGINSLKKQNGVIGLELPSNIEHNILKLKNNDIVLISTDGVNSYANTIFDIVDQDMDLQTITNHLINSYALKDDDALSSAIRYKNTGQDSYNFKKNRLKNSFEEKNIESQNNKPFRSNYTPNQQFSVDTHTIKSSSQENLLERSSNIKPLVKEYFFATVNNSVLARSKVSSMMNFLALDQFISIRLQSIILELLKNEIVHLDIYIANDIFQIQSPLKLDLLIKIIPLIYFCKFNYLKDEELIIIEYKLPFTLDATSQEYKNIKEMLFFGLDKENYEMYKKDKQKDRVMASQSKLAAMGEMVGAIAHQWRQPLNEVGIKIQKLKYAYKKNKIDEEYIDKYINDSMNTINFMSQTIDNFRNFFRVDKEKNIFNIEVAITEILDMQSAQLKNHNIKVSLEGKTFNFNGFKNEFQQVILNIVSNSKDACIKNKIKEPKISIKIDSTKIIIEDNGGGVDKDILERIFEPYFTTKDQGEGTGMGLYMSKKIIEDNLNGRIYSLNSKDGLQIIVELSGD